MNDTIFVFHYEDEGSQRLDHFLNAQMPDHSRTYLQKLIKAGQVLVDGEVAGKTGLKLDAKRTIEVRIPPASPSALVAEKIPLDIVFEDANVIIINKSAGMVVHPSAGHRTGTLVNAVLGYVPDIQGVGGEKRPGLIHRLDKDTSGVIVLAKNDQTHRFLQEQFKDREVDKRYLALLDGLLPTPSGRVEAPIGRDLVNRQRMAIVPEKKGRDAISEYLTLEVFEKHTYVEVNILTGRTHQIRVHMAFMKSPVVGDTIYGRRTPSIDVKRQMLHAASLSIILPDEKVKKIFRAPIPPDFENALSYLRK